MASAGLERCDLYVLVVVIMRDWERERKTVCVRWLAGDVDTLWGHQNHHTVNRDFKALSQTSVDIPV